MPRDRKRVAIVAAVAVALAVCLVLFAVNRNRADSTDDAAPNAASIRQRIEKARSVRELRADNANLDARVVSRSIELGEMRAALAEAEADRERLRQLVNRP